MAVDRNDSVEVVLRVKDHRHRALCRRFERYHALAIGPTGVRISSFLAPSAVVLSPLQAATRAGEHSPDCHLAATPRTRLPGTWPARLEQKTPPTAAKSETASLGTPTSDSRFPAPPFVGATRALSVGRRLFRVHAPKDQFATSRRTRASVRWAQVPSGRVTNRWGVPFASGARCFGFTAAVVRYLRLLRSTSPQTHSPAWRFGMAVPSGKTEDGYHFKAPAD